MCMCIMTTADVPVTGLAGEHLVEDRPQGIEVGLVADLGGPPDLLGGHVGRGPEGAPRPGQRVRSRSLAIPKSVSLSWPSRSPSGWRA